MQTAEVPVEIVLLGGFEVRTPTGNPAPTEWRRRPAASLVKLLALSRGCSLHRERVIDALWPDVTLVEAAPRLYKAAHFARRILGSQRAVVVQADNVALFPEQDVVVDAAVFEERATAALGSLDGDAVTSALGLYGGELLPQDIYEPWTYERRDRLQRLYLELLRADQRWDEVLAVEQFDEQAHMALLRRYAASGDRLAALRQYERMEQLLRDHLGVEPGPDAIALRDRIQSAVGTNPLPDGAAATATLPTSARGHLWLVERDEPLQTLRAAQREAATGLGGVVLICGEAGVGKTSLVEAFAGEMRNRAPMFISGCDDLLTAIPLGPFRDLARAGVDALRAALDDDDAEAVREVVLGLLVAAPTVLVVEDVHWVDDATLDVIRYVARRMQATPSLLVLTYRDDEVPLGHPLRGLLGSLTAPTAYRVVLHPLTASGVAQLADRAGLDVPDLHHITSGNPFFVSELLAAGPGTVPMTVRDAVLARVEGLPEPARQLLDRLSVIPTPVERGIAEAVCDGDGLAAMEVVERRGLLVGDAATVAFRHELARRSIEAALTPAERVVHHRRVAELMHDRHADPSRVMHHAVLAHHDQLIVAAGRVAAAAAERAGSHRQVVDHLREILARPQLLDPSERIDGLIRQARSLQVLNQSEASCRAALEAVSAAEEAADDPRLVRALLALGRTMLWAWGPNAAERAGRRALAVLGPEGDMELRSTAHADLARVLGEAATVGVTKLANPEAVEHAVAGLALADAVGKADVRARALTYLECERLVVEAGHETTDLDRAMAQLHGFPGAEFAVRACVNAANAAYRSGHLDAATRYADLGLLLARDTEFFSGEYGMRLTKASVRASLGQWQQAEVELHELLDAPGDPGILRVYVQSLLARLLGRRGRSDEANRQLAPAVLVASSSDEIRVIGPVAAAEVELAWLAGSELLPGLVEHAIGVAEAGAQMAQLAEVFRYMQRAGHPTPERLSGPEPWRSGLMGDWRTAADLWAARQEVYEQALELCASGEAGALSEGRRMLHDLGANAALAVYRGPPND